LEIGGWLRLLTGAVAGLTRFSFGAIWHHLATRLPSSTVERSLAAILRRDRTDVVLAEYGPTGVAMVGPCHIARVPLVVHFHGYDAYRYDLLEQYGTRYSDLFLRAAAVIAVSDDMRRQLVGLGAPEQRVHHIACGVDVDLFDECSPEDNPPRFLAVGRFVDKKAPVLTLLAFAGAARSFPDAHLSMIGDGPLRTTCEDLSVALGIGDRVSFPGVVEHAEVAREMARSRCFVQHSVRPPSGDSEGTPVAVLEASASGLPVVATRHGGIPDVVADGITGVLVAERDVEGMAEAMIEFANDPGLAGRVGASGRNRVRNRNRLDIALDRLRSVVGEAADGR
jgi:glycosyltransferase involved in cell wall biosynthesis